MPDRYTVIGIRRSGQKRLVLDLVQDDRRVAIVATGSPAEIERVKRKVLDALGDDVTLEGVAALLHGLEIVE